MLHGRMMDYPLTLTHFLERARTFFPRSTVTSRLPDGSIHRYTYADLHGRTCKLANALSRLGIRAGDRVGSLAWNHYRHLELYLGVPAMGAVLHTLNLRLHPTEIAYIARHAEDRVVVVDQSLLPLFWQVAPHAPSIEHVIVVPDVPAPQANDAPHVRVLDYEELIAPESASYDFPVLDEGAAAMLCYTSGTTGNPKGVLYSHRSTVLHTLVACMSDTLGICGRDVVMPVVPMFHANAWGTPFCAACVGAGVVFPGPKLDPTSLLDLMANERVTVAAGVPTIWLGILALLDEHPRRWDLSAMRTMIVGGSAAPASMIEGFRVRHGLEVTHAWGMTETNPLATVSRMKSHFAGIGGLDDAEKLSVRASQGFSVAFMEQRHVSDDGRVLPWDGDTMGELEVRGPWVVRAYFGGDEGRFSADGWFKTGDVVTIDREGYVRITDRSKDVIKSGGEWISSVALENAIMSHPSVLEAAVFAGAHPKWSERPLAAVVLKEGHAVSADDLRAHVEGAFPKFWVPDAFIFVKQVPRTSTGKFLKSKLRELYGNYLLD